jgi:hypothetical protein
MKGYITIYLILVILVLLAWVGAVSSILISSFRSLESVTDSFALEYLAEAGVAMATDKLKSTPGYFTDGSPKTPLKSWLIEDSIGSTMGLSRGGFKMVCPSGRSEFYAVGFLGKDILASRGYAFIKIKFEEEPFRVIEWAKF